MSFDQIVAHYGLAGLFLGAGVEGETVVIIGGLMAHRGAWSYWPAVAMAAAGSFVADQVFFLLGRRFRDHVLVRRMHAKPAFARALEIFDGRPMLFVFVFRFLYGLRTVSPVAIGTTRLPARTFLAINAAAAAVWGLVFVTIGYWFGQAIEAAFGRIRSVEHLFLGVVGVAVVLGVALHLVRKRFER